MIAAYSDRNLGCRGVFLSVALMLSWGCVAVNGWIAVSRYPKVLCASFWFPWEKFERNNRHSPNPALRKHFQCGLT